jgi:hypothetical protein
MNETEKLKILIETLQTIGEFTVPPNVSAMPALIEIQRMAADTLAKIGVPPKPRSPSLHLVK